MLVATKFFPLPWRLSRKSLISALRASLDRLGLEGGPLPDPFADAAPQRRDDDGRHALCVEAGLTSTVGVSNFDQSEMLRAYSTLARHNIPLASNQVHYSLLNRAVEKNGLAGPLLRTRHPAHSVFPA